MLRPDGESRHSVSDEICQKVKALVCFGPSSDVESLGPTCFPPLMPLINHSEILVNSFQTFFRFISSSRQKRTCRLCLRRGFKTEQQSAEKHSEMEPQWRRDLNEWPPTRPIMLYYSRKQWWTDLWGIKQSQNRTAAPLYYIGSSKYICCEIFKAFRLS